MNYFIKTSFLIILGIIVGTTQTCAQQEFKRNIEMRTFIPKGQWIVGSSVSYSQYSNDNYQFLVIENLSGEGYAFKVSPVLCYAFKDNVAAGGRFMYSRTYTKLNNISRFTVRAIVNRDLQFNQSFTLRRLFKNTLSIAYHIRRI